VRIAIARENKEDRWTKQRIDLFICKKKFFYHLYLQPDGSFRPNLFWNTKKDFFSLLSNHYLSSPQIQSNAFF